mmetsp:Transcript_63156/g.137303  ORF Transcript_63156/g.137303 Transcript_63156/m.137303 type:complete len:379 (-) Transcript_63156:118-1254(-)
MAWHLCGLRAVLFLVASSLLGAHGVQLRSGGSIFLLTAFSHDDTDQWVLMPHFFRHYMEHLLLDPEKFLLILHSDARNVSGLTSMRRRLTSTYGPVKTFFVTEPYSSRLHWKVKVELLQENVRSEDWIIQVDADEFLAFPGGRPAHEVLDGLDAVGINVHYGIMIDRIADDADLDTKPLAAPNIFVQFPRNCALTLMIQDSDVRKVSAYRGYLRTTSGNHNVIGLNRSSNPRSQARALDALRSFLTGVGQQKLFDSIPGAASGRLSVIRHSEDLASVYHFKWVRGLADKLHRRASTEVYSRFQYFRIREFLGLGTALNPHAVKAFCIEDRTSDSGRRALSPQELVRLFVDTSGVPDRFAKRKMMESLERAIAHEQWDA